MASIPTYIAKAKLSELIRRALNGEVVCIGRGSEGLVQLVPIKKVQRKGFGSMKGHATVGDEFFAPLPEDELKAWE
jgi:prevent-host-death family protein